MYLPTRNQSVKEGPGPRKLELEADSQNVPVCGHVKLKLGCLDIHRSFILPASLYKDTNKISMRYYYHCLSNTSLSSLTIRLDFDVG